MSGWFALVRETGFSDVLPVGEGLLSFEDAEGILEGIERIAAQYELHCRQAREIAEEHFAGTNVLRSLLQTAGMA